MSVFKRTTCKGTTKEYHYRFMQSGKLRRGVCEGCTTERQALDYEKGIKKTAKTLAQQKTVIALIENTRDELSGGDVKSITIADAYSHYVVIVRSRTPGKDQEARNCNYMKDFVAFMADQFPDITMLRNVSKRHAEKYIYELKTSGTFRKELSFVRNGKESVYENKNTMLSPRTINARHKLLKSVFHWLKDDAGIIVNPFDFGTVEGKPESRDVFSDEELQKIGEAATMPYTKPIFIIGLCTGLSLSDICLLKWSNIKDGFICTNRRKTGVYLEIPILPPLKKFLSEQFPISGHGEYIAPVLAQMYLDNPTGVNHRVKTFLEGMGIKTAVKLENRSRAVSNKAAHALRHTFAYLAGVHEIPLMIVKSILGHMSPKMTELYQAHASRRDKQKFLSKMPVALIGDVDVVIKPPPEPEREQLRQLVGSLSVEAITKLLNSAKGVK